MNEELYIRSDLTATRQQLADPALLIDLWLDRLLDLWQVPSGDRISYSYDLLAGWARLKRARPDLVANTGRLDEWGAVDAEIRSQGLELARLAVQLPDPDGWLDEADRYENALYAPVEDADLGEWSERLLTDLDDADLAVWAVRQLDRPAENLEEKLKKCGSWLEEKAAAFAPCGVYIQAVGLSLRPDLPLYDLALAWTADKYVVLLDALEEVESLLTCSPCPVFPVSFVLETLGNYVDQIPTGSQPISAFAGLIRAAKEFSGLAATGGKRNPSEAELRLASIAFAVNGDSSISIKMGIKSTTELEIWLAGSADAMRRYARILLEFPNREVPLEASFRRTFATLLLPDDAIKDLCSGDITPGLILVDRAGSRFPISIDRSNS